MTQTNITYTGKGFNDIVTYVDSQPDSVINGKMIHQSGSKVADVTFCIEGDDLKLYVNNEPYSNVTEAVRALADAQATNCAEGSNEDGNAANNVIGNYNITKHIIFGQISLSEIIGSSDSTDIKADRKPRARKSVGTARITNAGARVGFYQKYNAAVAKGIADKFGRDELVLFFDEKGQTQYTLNDVELRFGTAANDFDLNVYA